MRLMLCILLVSIFASRQLPAQESAIVESKFKAAGACGMCKARIENAVKTDGVDFARWNKSRKELAVAYHPEKITLDSLQRRVAAVGHDTERFRAPDSIYSSLPSCCLYRKGGRTH